MKETNKNLLYIPQMLSTEKEVFWLLIISGFESKKFYIHMALILISEYKNLLIHLFFSLKFIFGIVVN